MLGGIVDKAKGVLGGGQKGGVQSQAGAGPANFKTREEKNQKLMKEISSPKRENG